MKIDFNTVITGFDGGKITQDGHDVTARLLVIEALNRLYKDDDSCSGEDRTKRADLSIKIYNSEEEVSLTVDEVAFIKTYVNKATFSPIVYKRLISILEGEDVTSQTG